MVYFFCPARSHGSSPIRWTRQLSSLLISFNFFSPFISIFNSILQDKHAVSLTTQPKPKTLLHPVVAQSQLKNNQSSERKMTAIFVLRPWPQPEPITLHNMKSADVSPFMIGPRILTAFQIREFRGVTVSRASPPITSSADKSDHQIAPEITKSEKKSSNLIQKRSLYTQFDEKYQT